MNNLESLQDKLNYNFKNLNLLKTSLTHISYANDNNEISYDRLEFLGDSIIEFIVSDYLYSFLPENSGVLTKLRASLVSTDNLQKISQKLSLTDYVLKSKSLPQISKKNTADLFESVIGAVYLDGGLESAKDIIYKYIIIDENNIKFMLENCVDAKTKLQELMQASGKEYKYNLVHSSGKDHEKIFTVSLEIAGEIVATSKATSIQKAEENCAEIYLKSLQK